MHGIGSQDTSFKLFRNTAPVSDDATLQIKSYVKAVFCSFDPEHTQL